MPKQDRTGPWGEGPPGRGLGPCGQGRGHRGRGGANQGGSATGFQPGRGGRREWADGTGEMLTRPPQSPAAPTFQDDRSQTALQPDKIAVSSQGPGLDDPVDPRFGRAAGFVIVDPQTMEFTYLDNLAARDMGSGAGIQAAETVARSGARIVLTGSVGPKAMQVLAAAGIRAVQDMENLTVREVVTRFRDDDAKTTDPVLG
jgi:predicted Fe-Mo cluster-binding NifX family protein